MARVRRCIPTAALLCMSPGVAAASAGAKDAEARKSGEGTPIIVDGKVEDFFVGGDHDYGTFSMQRTIMHYMHFVPRLYNLVLSFGFSPGQIMPSRAFCSDENQGGTLVLLTKHFGTFPFNHGIVGGVVATDRHGPHAHHGQDLLLIQASHVGYEPDTGAWGTYRRTHVGSDRSHSHSPTCGKVHGILSWYIAEYNFAVNNIHVTRDSGSTYVTIDNFLLEGFRTEGLFLNMDLLVQRASLRHSHPMPGAQGFRVHRTLSTRVEFHALPAFADTIPTGWTGSRPIGTLLSPDMFFFKKDLGGSVSGKPYISNLLEFHLQRHMPTIVTSPMPHLAAAVFNVQAEFDRTFRSIVKEKEYKGHNFFFVSGLNIDISPKADALIPATAFIPWAAMRLHQNGTHQIYEQADLVAMLKAQPTENANKIDLEQALTQMSKTADSPLTFDVHHPGHGPAAGGSQTVEMCETQ